MKIKSTKIIINFVNILVLIYAMFVIFTQNQKLAKIKCSKKAKVFTVTVSHAADTSIK